MLIRNLLRPLSATVAGFALLGVLAGCSSSAPSTGSSPSAAEATGVSSASATPAAASSADCAQVEALKASLVALGDVNVVKDGVDALNSAIATVKTDLDAASATASSNLAPELDQVRTALAAVQTATSGVTKDNVRDKAPAIASSLRQLTTATSALSEALAHSCVAS